LRRLLIPDFLIGVTQGITGTLFIFYMRSVGGFETAATTLLLIYFVAALAGVPLWIWAGKRFGKHRALQLGCLWWAAMMLLIPFFPKGDFALVSIGLAIAGIAQSATILLVRAMMADVVDEDQVTTGQQRSGLFFGLLITTGKVGIATGPVSLIVASAFGFQSQLGSGNSETALFALTMLFTLAPAVFLGLAVLTLQNYPLDEKRQRELRELIAAREASR
jgi:Na+/melibiose symporter-like transporter